LPQLYFIFVAELSLTFVVADTAVVDDNEASGAFWNLYSSGGGYGGGGGGYGSGYG